MAIKSRKGYNSGRGDDPHGVTQSDWRTGKYMGKAGGMHFFSAEGTGGDSTDSVTFEDIPGHNPDYNVGSKYVYNIKTRNLPTPYTE